MELFIKRQPNVVPALSRALYLLGHFAVRVTKKELFSAFSAQLLLKRRLYPELADFIVHTVFAAVAVLLCHRAERAQNMRSEGRVLRAADKVLLNAYAAEVLDVLRDRADRLFFEVIRKNKRLADGGRFGDIFIVAVSGFFHQLGQR